MFGRKKFMIHIIQTGSLLVLAAFLLFLCPFSGKMLSLHIPLLIYGEERESEEESLLCKSITIHVPLYAYLGREGEMLTLNQSPLTEEQILLLEARDEEEGWENDVTLLDEMKKENEKARTGEETEKEAEGNSDENMKTDGELPAQPVANLNMEDYQNFDKLLEKFYVVDKTTYIDGEELNIDNMLNKDLTLKKDVTGPQILIYHTHSQEGYADSVPGDKSTTVVGAGEKLAKLLTEEYGLQVLHHTGEYDVESRDYAYANVTPALEQILAENPSIEVIIDLHRDGVADGTRLITEVNGKQTAQFMFFNGLSRLKNTGEIGYLQNDNRVGNLAFSFRLQLKCEEYYPGLARKIYLKGYRYNLQYREKSLLVELGAQTNTLEEVNNALPPLAHVIAMVLKGE